jgi:hypothetical protein
MDVTVKPRRLEHPERIDNERGHPTDVMTATIPAL